MDNKNYTENFFNLQLLLKKSNEFIRNLFIESYSKTKNDIWIENGTSANCFFETKNGTIVLNMMTSKQKKIAQFGDTSKWDLSLFYLIFANTELIDKSKLKQIEKIKEIRNKLAHNSKMSLNDQEFKTDWSVIVQSLIQLGMKKNEIDKYWSNLKKNDSKKLNNKEQIDNLKEKADQHFAQNNFCESIKLYSQAIEIDMSNDLKSKLYSNRSLAYLKMFEKLFRQNTDFLYKALIDAEQSINFNPKWFKPYARLAQVYVELNEREKAIENFTKALVLNPSSMEIKSMLANSKYLNFEQNRYSHFDKNTQPKTTEERFEEILQKQSIHFGMNDSKKLIENLDDLKKIAIELDKSLEDVYLAHEYRDGSLNCKQDYQMAAKLYSKAASCGNVEAMYNLAQLTLHGKGVKQNHQMAVSLLKNAASQSAFRKIGKTLNEVPVVGVAESQHLLGILYQEGIYVNKNMALAIDYYEMAVNNGFPYSANNLGILYFCGDGVNVDFDRAENLFLFCHKKGCSDSISNLVDLYLAKGDTTSALLWHKRALENNSLFDLSRNQIIMDKIDDLNKNKKLANIPLNKSIDSYLKDNFPQLNLLKTNFMLKCYPSGNKSRNYDLDMLLQHANKGSTLAQKMILAKTIFYDAIYDYIEKKNMNNFEFSSVIERMSKAYLIEYLVCQLPLELQDELIEKLEKILSLNQHDQMNLNASICYMNLMVNNYEQTIMFIDEALKKYPDCLQMYLIKGSMYCFLEKYEHALREFEYLIKMDPKNYDYYYSKAAVLKYLGRFNEALKYYDIFVQNSEKDVRKLPEAYYSMGQCRIALLSLSKNKNPNIINKVIQEYVDKGKQAERDQLPCFLPYESSSKDLLLIFIDVIENKVENIKEFDPQKDNYRVELIKQHRKSFIEIQNLCPIIFKTTLSPPKDQKTSFSLESFNQISLKQIDFSKDEILEKYFINIRIFDYPLFGFTSVFFIVDDQDGSMERLSIYNLGDDYDKIRQDFKIGTWITIINPYIRQAADGKPMIRVDDVKSIMFTGKFTNKMCQYCGKSDSKFNCSKCMKAFYCSKQCQVNDWKELNHKHVCS